MAIDWDDNKNRKAFREALQEVYPSAPELEQFVDEELNKNLAVVAGGDNLQATAHGLVKWAKAKGRLDEVYEAFKQENPRHGVIEKLERQALVSQTVNLAQDDWDMLFGQFLPHDLADLQRAFLKSFKQALGLDFHRAQPKHPPLVEITQIRELLEIYDADDKGPVLVVRFVEGAIAEFQRSSEGNNRDLVALEQWRNRIAEKFKVPPPSPPSSQTTARHAYLLVALEEIGSDVNVYPELHITDAESPIGFGAKPTTCPIVQVIDHISEWIRQAEDFLEADFFDDTEVTLEVFLPCKYLVEDIGTTWRVKDKWGDEVDLGTHRKFLVRSSERILDRKIQRILEKKWKLLEDYIKMGSACSKFHEQIKLPEKKGDLSTLLKNLDTPGLKLAAKLPNEAEARRRLLEDIIDAAIPIALWPSEVAEADVGTLKIEFDGLLRCNLTDFAQLAMQWQNQRIVSAAAKQIRLLCDRPDRLPRLPDLRNREDEDAIVAC